MNIIEWVCPECQKQSTAYVPLDNGEIKQVCVRCFSMCLIRYNISSNYGVSIVVTLLTKGKQPKMKNEIQTFWIVVADRPEMRSTVKHPTFISARTEAMRLAGANYGVMFYVFQVVGGSKVEKPESWISATDLPF